MTKDQLAALMAEEANISQKAATIALTTLLNAITETVSAGNTVN